MFTIGNPNAFCIQNTFYLDGSGGSATSDPRLRRCGWGSVVVDCQDLLCPELISGRFGALPESQQTVPRAELYAAVYTLEHCTADRIVLMSDCKYFVDNAGLPKEHSVYGVNGDLWERYFDACAPKQSVEAIKVAAHGELEQLVSGSIRWEDYIGNSYADKLAGEGAARAALPDSIISLYAMTDAIAWKVQARLVEIVCAAPTKEQDSVEARAHAQLKEQRLARAREALEADVESQDPVVDIEALELDLGPPEIPAKFGEARSSALHHSHRLQHKRGVTWCSVCGAYGTTRGRKLLQPCQPPTATGVAQLCRIRRGLTPHNSVKWTS